MHKIAIDYHSAADDSYDFCDQFKFIEIQGF